MALRNEIITKTTKIHVPGTAAAPESIEELRGNTIEINKTRKSRGIRLDLRL